MSASITQYTDLISNQHADKTNFIATIQTLVQPLADISANLLTLPGLLDVDVAVGDQLDKVGEWVGVSRNIDTIITGVYFAFDTLGVGFDQGNWYGPYNPVTGITSLPDDSYRTLIKSRIANNNWDGSTHAAALIWQQLFAGKPYTATITDNSNMTMTVTLSATPDVVTQALLTGGYLNTKPAGVSITYSIP